MKTTTIGHTDIRIPALCVGTMGFSDNPDNARAWAVDYETSRDIIQAALDAGLYFFDTAPVYSDGASERALGKALKELGVARSEVVISTKYYPRSPREIAAGVSMKDHIRHWLKGSLERLQTDYADLLYLHMWDWHTPIEETITVLNELMAEGKIRAAGLSNVFAWQLAMANEKARALGLQGFAAVQNQWNLISREDERELVSCMKVYGVTPIPYASLAAGRLARPAGTVTKRSQLDAYGEKKFSTQKEADGRIIRGLGQAAEELDAPMSSVALAWLMAKGAVPLAGATKPSQVAGLKQATELELPEAVIIRLEQDYVPHALTGVLAEHDPQQDAHEYYGVYGMHSIL